MPDPGADPLVTVVLAVHDQASRLHHVVDNVQAQTYPGWELVVVDDGSTDDTAAVLTGIAAFEPRVVPVTVPRGGPGRARNAALKHLGKFGFTLFLGGRIGGSRQRKRGNGSKYEKAHQLSP